MEAPPRNWTCIGITLALTLGFVGGVVGLALGTEPFFGRPVILFLLGLVALLLFVGFIREAFPGFVKWWNDAGSDGANPAFPTAARGADSASAASGHMPLMPGAPLVYTPASAQV
jgi:hypothetical protein